jgi:plastocyanin
MKNQYIKSIITAISLLYVTNLRAEMHTVSVQDFVFNPSVVNVNVGDTIMWNWSSGNHTTTSVSVPLGAITWDEQIDHNHTMFMYIITQPGTYNYECSYHASMGMTGSINATGTSGIPTAQLSPTFKTNGNIITDHLSISFSDKSNERNVSIMDLTGKVIKTFQASSPVETIPVGDIPNGLYLVTVIEGTSSNTVRIIKQ